MAKITTVRVLLALATSKDWKQWPLDVKNPFLHRELDREVYMNQPKGFESSANPNHVCKLRKAHYGLKQAPKTWYGKIAEFLTESGYSVAHADSSLFIKEREGKLAIVLVYVFKLGSGTISWCSKRQPTVSLSTTKVEYRVAAGAAQESTWLKLLREDLHQRIDYPI